MDTFNEQMAKLAQCVNPQNGVQDCVAPTLDPSSINTNLNSLPPIPEGLSGAAHFAVPVPPVPATTTGFTPPTAVPEMPGIFRQDPVQGVPVSLNPVPAPAGKKPLISKKSFGILRWVLLGLVVLVIGFFIVRGILKKKKAAAAHKKKLEDQEKEKKNQIAASPPPTVSHPPPPPHPPSNLRPVVNTRAMGTQRKAAQVNSYLNAQVCTTPPPQATTPQMVPPQAVPQVPGPVSIPAVQPHTPADATSAANMSLQTLRNQLRNQSASMIYTPMAASISARMPEPSSDNAKQPIVTTTDPNFTTL